MKWVGFVAAVVMAFSGSAASARWYEVSSDHFVVYADDNEKDLTLFSEQLERYHAAMDFITTGEYPKPSPSNRVTVYVVKNEAEVRRLAGPDTSRWLQGFYVPRAGGSIAIIPRVDAARGDINESMLTLLHEYAHHFTISASAMALPRWVSEGSAEFYASAKFLPDGGVSIGRPAGHRGLELHYAKDVTATDLLDPDSYEKRKSKAYDSFYGKSWLLYHYLVFNEGRRGQLSAYLTKIGEGVPAVDAAKQAFGDFGALEKELDRYLNAKRMMTFNIKPSMLPVGAINLRPLREGEAAMMDVRIRSKRGVDRETAPAVLTDARAVAARYPSDPAVLAALAEAEYDAGNDKEAIAAADKAIVANPDEINAYVQKGYAQFRLAEAAKDEAAAYRDVRKTFVALNKIENDHPLPLIYFYRTYAALGKPPELAVQGLERAVELAPFDMGLRANLARQYMRDKKYKEARNLLAPVAYNPHGGSLASAAQKLIEKIDQGQVTEAEAAELDGEG